MIPKDTVDRIIDASRIEEVIGDFISLKRRGANLLGVCPFHNEKTPSFTVSPAKGIYKCFGCGKAGNSVNFIMEHESLSYPEALKFLAAKYKIEIEEREISPEEKAQLSEKESMMVVMSYAQKFFSETMRTTDEGKSVGLGYFQERGFREDSIEKFQLGYSPEERKAFSKAAVEAGYKPEYLIKTGLSILPEKYAGLEEIKLDYLFDRYSGRVIFPIHGVTGRVIGFGGRILNNDKKLAKYINSPQTDIYDKSKVLYGLFFAKKTIIQEDNCYLVEGYTDVISMHQAGIENVVSSSGTSLTVEQIRLIHRFTKNITILYDGDFAGIKASFRGIDLILEEGMNVKVLLFPDGDDPDSYSKKVSQEELKSFIKENSKDFISFKTSLLIDEVKNDPIKKAGLIREIMSSVSLVPDSIQRAIYIKECARIMEFEESILTTEVSKLIRHRSQKIKPVSQKESEEVKQITEEEFSKEEILENNLIDRFGQFERNLIRLLLHYGRHIIDVDIQAPENTDANMEISLAEYVVFELYHDELTFTSPLYQAFLDDFVARLQDDFIPDEKYYLRHANPELSNLAVSFASESHQLSDNWTKKFNIHVSHESDDIRKTVMHDLLLYKERRLNEILQATREALKEAGDPIETDILLFEIRRLDNFKARVNKMLSRTIIP